MASLTASCVYSAEESAPPPELDSRYPNRLMNATASGGVSLPFLLPLLGKAIEVSAGADIVSRGYEDMNKSMSSKGMMVSSSLDGAFDTELAFTFEARLRGFFAVSFFFVFHAERQFEASYAQKEKIDWR